MCHVSPPRAENEAELRDVGAHEYSFVQLSNGSPLVNAFRKIQSDIKPSRQGENVPQLLAMHCAARQSCLPSDTI